MITTTTVSYDDDDDPSSASIVHERRRVRYRQEESPRRRRHHSDKGHSSLVAKAEEVVKVRVNLDADDIVANKQQRGRQERPDFDGGCFELLNKPSGETMTKQILPPRPEIPTKPTTSCIMPKFKEQQKSKPINRDPVQLYAYYQKHWDKLRLPGDGSDKQLRWAVREWMMGDPKK